MTKTERWLNLLAFLLDRRYPVTREEILSQVDDYKADWVRGNDKKRESVRRKFERDKKELKALGVVIEPLKDRVMAEHAGQEVEAYLLKPREFYLPYLAVRRSKGVPAHPYYLNTVTLDAGELPILRRAAERVAALQDTPLGAAARSALRKLAFDLPELGVGDEERAFVQAAAPEADEQFALLRRAVEQRRAVRCRYYTIGRDAEEERVVEPYGLMLSWGHWYCVGRSRERKAMRVFRLDRMKRVALVQGAKAEFGVPGDFRIGAYLDRAPWELSDEKPVTARVRIAFPQSRWVIGERLGKVVKAVTDDAGTELEFQVRSVDAFVRWLLPLGGGVEVLSPPAIKRQLDEARSRLRAVYR
ncbi:MAG TPA: WYL domain-containing protein [Gemmatimonadales bacterium]|nr:WYL domain-containing protein [Gemmatimonadales bacterium]